MQYGVGVEGIVGCLEIPFRQFALEVEEVELIAKDD